MELELRPGDRADLVCDADLPGARTLYKQDAHPHLGSCAAIATFCEQLAPAYDRRTAPTPCWTGYEEITKSNSWGDTDEILTDGLAGWILVPVD